MQLLLDYLPVAAFFGAYFYADIYFATTVLMVVMPIFLLLQWLIKREMNRIYLASTALVLVLGSATLFFRNPTFLYWKPTVLNWVIGLVFLGSQWIGAKPIVQRMLESAASLSRLQWLRLNQLWSAFLFVVGVINIFVACSFSEPTWVTFKLFGMLGLTLVFVVIQTIWLTHAVKKNPAAETPVDGGGS